MFYRRSNYSEEFRAVDPQLGIMLRIRPAEIDGYIGNFVDEDGELISAKPIIGSTPKSILDHANSLVNI